MEETDEIAQLAEWAVGQCDGDRQAAIEWLSRMADYLDEWKRRGSNEAM